MKRTPAVLGTILLLMAAAGFVLWERGGRQPAAEGQGVASDRIESREPSEPQTTNGDPSISSATGAELAAPRSSEAARKVVVPLEELSDRSSANLALSADEARWLRQNGYPSYWELHNLHALDWTAIESAAFRGDEVAQNLLAERLLAAGDVDRAAATFGNPRGIPSVYAMLRSSELRARTGRYPRAEDNYTLFMLHAEYARLMGDHQIDAVIQSVLPSHMDRQALQRAALRSLPDFARSQFDTAARTGLPPPRPSARPNAAQWRDIRSGASQAVTYQAPSPYMPPPGN